MASKIPATIVTGFLGSGKTTLIRHMLQNAGGRRIALLINEFGDLGVDGEILRGCGIEECSEGEIVELSNGCICCTVAEDFIPTMQALLSQGKLPDNIVIETSGLALPQPLVRAFGWPEIRNRLTVDSVIAVVDGEVAAGKKRRRVLPAPSEFELDEPRLINGSNAARLFSEVETPPEHGLSIDELFEDQLACADLVVLSKGDLITEEECKEIETELVAKIRRGVRILTAVNGAIDPAVLLGLGLEAECDPDSRNEIHHVHADGEDHGEHDEFESFVVELPQVRGVAELILAVERAMEDFVLLRVKGFASIAGKSMRLVVQAVGPNVEKYFDRPFEAGEPRETRLVVIGHSGLDREGISRRLREAVQ
ncbi:MAG: cobalamin biosynthesis protein CobW [Albidovulum sp.]|nr:cobalamin biosynthesis protein CobW [Albidovulum sp.]